MDISEARVELKTLHNDLHEVLEKDQEQEVRGVALPVIDAVIRAGRDLLPSDDPVVCVVTDLISSEAIDVGEPIRAVDVFLVVGQLIEALGRVEQQFFPVA